MLQFIIGLTSALAIWMTFAQPGSVFRTVGPVIGLVGQPAWLYETFAKEQWGMFFVSIVITGVWTHGVYLQWFAKTDESGRLLAPDYRLAGRWRTLIWRLQGALNAETELNKRVEVESYLHSCSGGRKPLPNSETCRWLAMRLGVPRDRWTDYERGPSPQSAKRG